MRFCAVAPFSPKPFIHLHTYTHVHMKIYALIRTIQCNAMQCRSDCVCVPRRPREFGDAGGGRSAGAAVVPAGEGGGVVGGVRPRRRAVARPREPVEGAAANAVPRRLEFGGGGGGLGTPRRAGGLRGCGC
jgi:hypothetical protein